MCVWLCACACVLVLATLQVTSEPLLNALTCVSQKCSIVTSLTLIFYIFKLCCVKMQFNLLIKYIISVRRGSNNIFVSVLNVQVADMVLLNLCFIKNSVYPTNENTAVSHYINLIIFTLPSLSACGANEISLIIRYNLTPFSSTHKDVCVSRRSPKIRWQLHRIKLVFLHPLFEQFNTIKVYSMWWINRVYRNREWTFIQHLNVIFKIRLANWPLLNLQRFFSSNVREP